MNKERVGVEIALLAVLVVSLSLHSAYAEVQTVNISPPVVVIDQPITFSGFVSGQSLEDRIGVYVYAGPNCATPKAIASTFTIANLTQTIGNQTVGEYNVSLTFPVTNSTGWTAEPSYQYELPVGNYSVGVRDVTTSVGLCKNFTVTNTQPTPEFTTLLIAVLLPIIAALYVTRRKTGNSS
jgi:hypothetical protein